MHTSRRQFLKCSAALAGVSLLSKTAVSATAADWLVGVQLYSIRDDMKKDPLGSLKEVAAMGYKHVEHANYVNRKFYGYSAQEFRKILNDLGLSMPSGHTVMAKKHWDETRKDFTDEWKYTVEDAAILGQKYVISPWLEDSLRKNYDDLVRYMEVFNKSGELCKRSGMRFGYHNHDFEFSEKLNGVTVYDIILKNTDPDLVIQQLDIGNLYNGGAKAIEVVKQYPGRFKSLHVKDEVQASGGQEKYESTILGNGIVNVKEVIDACRKTGGTEHYIIEQEAYQGKTPMESIKEDLRRMSSWGY
ncbi:MAG TPA: TIM barrel protein [Chryseosolibacter sp.]|nr:TIM barrel protein [Chryseosolibacter sp.]